MVGLRLVVDCVHATCVLDFEKPAVRTFYLHSGGAHDRCHHGQANATSLYAWACLAAEKQQAFTLPEIPHLPVLLSLFVALVLLVVFFEDRARIAANGRAPPTLLFGY